MTRAPCLLHIPAVRLATLSLALLAGACGSGTERTTDSGAQGTANAANEAAAAAPSTEGMNQIAAERVTEQEAVIASSKRINAPFGPVEIVEHSFPDASHAQSGEIDVSYLRKTGDGTVVAKHFPATVRLGSFGSMSDWSVDNRFARYPVIVSNGGGTWQGQTCSWTVLTELRPEGPVELVSFENSYDNSGYIGDDNENSEKATSVESEIDGIEKDKSFTVRFTGTQNFTARYVRQGDKYRLDGGEDHQLSGC